MILAQMQIQSNLDVVSMFYNGNLLSAESYFKNG